ncbi:MAG: acyltransferase [Fermentimonas sp.]|nr:acyltransferase [Fermentimonas sp.]
MKVTRTEYYTPMNGVIDQVKLSSKKRGISLLRFVVRKLRNYLCEVLAYKCPVNPIRIKLHKWRGVNIGERVMVGMEVVLDHAYPEYITLEDDCGLAGFNYILTHTNPRQHFENILDSYVAPVTIKKGAWIAVGAMILPGVTVGEFSIVSAGSIVTSDVPPYTVVSGNPAKVVSKFNPKQIHGIKGV